MEDATIRGTLTITGGTEDSELLLRNITVEGDLDLSGFDGQFDLDNVEVGGDTIV